MSGRELLDYHERTKHSYESVREPGAGLDWANEPSPFKEYVGLPRVPLPPFRARGVRAIDAIAGASGAAAELDLETLSFLLFHAAGVSRVLRASHGAWHFRTYASAGALYPNEVYVVAGDIGDLDAGVYHYSPRDHTLGRLRSADARANLGPAGAGALSLVITGIPWRTAWKYGARGFRHLYWDAGMIVANLLASASAAGCRAEVGLGFVDADANRVIGVDGRDEFALCIVTLGEGDAAPPADLDALDPEVEPISPRPQRDPAIEAAHEAVVLRDDEAVRSFLDGSAGAAASVPGPGTESADVDPVRVEPLGRERLSEDPLERVVRRRGSTRALEPASFPAQEYTALQDLASAPIPADWGAGGVAPRVIASALEGLAPGAYAYDPGGSFGLVHEGEMRRKAGFVCLEQRLGAEAAAAVFLTADLVGYVGRLGGRGYAAAQLEAAIVAGRLYLGAYAQCLGASGITFYDDEVRSLFRTNDEPMLAFVMGPEGGRESVIRCRRRFEPAAAG